MVALGGLQLDIRFLIQLKFLQHLLLEAQGDELKDFSKLPSSPSSILPLLSCSPFPIFAPL